MKFFDIENIAFTLGGTGVSFLELIGVIAGLTCVVMAGRNSKYNFWVGYLYNILLFTLFWQRHLYSAMLLQPIAFGINAFGHWRWTHPRPEEQSSKDPLRPTLCRIWRLNTSRQTFSQCLLHCPAFGMQRASWTRWKPVPDTQSSERPSWGA